MEIKGKKVLIIGLAISGLQTVKTLHRLGAHITVNDQKNEGELKKTMARLGGMDIRYVLGDHPVSLADWPDLAVISPGVPMELPMVQEMLKTRREVISEIELASRFTQTPITAITGTNGKTTTTAMVGEIMTLSGRKTYVAGNIGTPLIEVAVNSGAEDILVVEVSSFQLESIKYFKPAAAAVLNITPDHMDRHRTFKNYQDIKAKIFENQGSGDYAVLNADEPATAALKARCKAEILYFSRKRVLHSGAFVEKGDIIIKMGTTTERICALRDLKVPGVHNLENALAAAALTWCAGVPAETIGKGLKSFGGVEHRLEYVDTVNGVKYINDSKGTNPEASINAIKALKGPIVIIAGGYDKGGDFDGFVQEFGCKVKSAVLMGSTAGKLKSSCRRMNMNSIYIAKDMSRAVNKASQVAEAGDTVLLSPACASWDMYDNFEERGRDFKKAVAALGRLPDG